MQHADQLRPELMALKGLPLKLLQELKYQHGFPPRSRVTEIKNEMAARGLGRSSMLAHEVANAYLKVIETIVDEFAERALSKNGALGLGGQADIRAAVMAAHEELFDVAASLVGGEVGAGDYGRLAVTAVNDRRESVREHLERRVDLHVLEADADQTTRELDQKFRILLSARQAQRDFESRIEAARTMGTRSLFCCRLGPFQGPQHTIHEREGR